MTDLAVWFLLKSILLKSVLLKLVLIKPTIARLLYKDNTPLKTPGSF